MLFSCGAEPVTTEDANLEALMTEYSEDLSIVMSESGRKSYHFETPLMEGYGMARDPYREFRKGIKITSFDKDSVGAVAAVLVANYAINYENRHLWEAKGDVVVTKSDGKKLFTSQLFWNQATKRIYSNVDSKIVIGEEVHNCEGFETDESMTDWTYRKLTGVTYFDSADEAEASAAGRSDMEPAAAPSAADEQADSAGRKRRVTSNALPTSAAVGAEAAKSIAAKPADIANNTAAGAAADSAAAVRRTASVAADSITEIRE